MTTIELTPDIVFERADSVTSPIPTHWGPTSTTPRPKSKPKPYTRGYHSVGSATLPTRGRKGGKNGSEYGIMISIKDIKGHPFVVLEDKDKQKHMVQAPENEGNSSVLSSEGYNGYTPEPENDDTGTNLSMSDVNPFMAENLRRQASPSPVPRLRSRESAREFGGRQKISTAAKTRSRSVPPGRAGQEKKQQRARSVSPQRRDHPIKPVDSERIKPVKGLIGFFEATSPVENAAQTFPKVTKANVVPPATTSKIREVSNRMNSQRVVSPTSTVSISSANSSIDVSRNSRRSNLRVSTVESPSGTTKIPEGRYFAVTSPGAMQSKGTFTLPRLTNIEKPADYIPQKAGPDKLTRSLSSEPHEPKSYGPKGYDKSYVPAPFLKSQDKVVSKPAKMDASEEEKIWETRKRPSYLPSYQRNLQAGDSFPRRKQAPEQSVAPSHTNGEMKKPSTPSNANRVSSNVDKHHHTDKVGRKPMYLTQVGAGTPKKEDNLITKTETTPEESSSTSTHVSKAKFIGPSQMLLNKTRRKRSARKLSTAMSESEYSESEFSDAESLKLGEDAYKNDEDENNDTSFAADKEVLSITAAVPQSVTPEPNDELIKQLGHRRTPSIKFEKIASEDVSKKVEKDEVDLSALNEQKERADNLEEKLKKANDKIHNLSDNISHLESKLRKAECDIDIKNAENGLLQREVVCLKKDLEEALSSDEEEKQSLLSLQRNLRIAKREASALEETITLLESQKSTLKSQLQDARREREDGEIQIRALKHEIEKHQSKSNEQERGVEGVRKELSRAKRQAEAQIQDLEGQLQKTEQKCHDLQLENSTIEKQLYELKHQQLANENEDVHFNETIRQLEQSKLKALQDMEAANTEIDQKSRALREAERKNNNLQEELRRMDKEMEEELKERESMLMESRQLDQRVKEMKAQQQVANREIEMLKKELDNAKSKDKVSDAEVETLQDLLDKKEHKMESLAKKNRALQKQIEDETAARLDQDFEGLTSENQRLSDEVNELKKQLRETEIEFMATKDALEDLRADLKKATVEAERERHKASEIGGDAQELKEDYDKMKSTLEQREMALKNAREAIGKIENQMKDYEESHSQAEEEKHQLEIDRDETIREMEALKLQVDSQNKQIGDANKTIKDLREKLADDMKSSLDGIERMAEMKKELQRLQSVVDEKSQQVFAAEETIYRQKEVIEEMSAIQENAKKATLEEMEKFMTSTEKQFTELKKEVEKKNDEIKRLETEKRDLEEELDELEQQNPHYDDDHEKEEELVNLSQKLREEENDKRQLFARLQTTQDKLGNALNEIEVQRSRAQMLLEEKLKYNDNVEDLHDQIQDLEYKLDQEAIELNNIKAHHVKTEMKLRDVLKQAQDETDKAIGEKEILAVRNDALEKQIEEAESALKMAENSRRDIENDLQQQIEANYKLQQTLSALGIGHSPGGSDGQGSLLTSV